MKIRFNSITAGVIVILLGLFIIIYGFNQHILIFNQTQLKFEKKIISSQSTFLSTPVLIDDLDPNFNWSRTAQENEWCYGSGSWSDPYIIENITIDAEFIIIHMVYDFVTLTIAQFLIAFPHIMTNRVSP